eukprot:TRINITY_DN9264_c0_g1_i1.p1 TRINITY_DN9264_c0_g1~~TRINITY_DN9264_c0_g1_i1.p1  ORF type:complete len:428 (-),score=68.11 TRINITY_DN9264_c0_g1_i1:470-1753(-)
MEHQYSLKWNNHPKNISNFFSRLRDEEQFVDVSLASADRQVIRAHKVVLSAGSGYFESILSGIHGFQGDPVTIILSNINHRELKLLVDFMYTGEISVEQPLLGSLLEAAHWLNIKGLCEKSRDEEGKDSSPPEVQEDIRKSPGIGFQEEIQRKRQWSAVSAESSVGSESLSASPQLSPPAKQPRQVYGVANTGWVVDNIKKDPQEKSPAFTDVHDIPSLLDLANRQNFIQHLNVDNPGKVDTISLNEQMMQAMQLCGTSYLSQLAVLQNCSQAKPAPAPSFTGSFTSISNNQFSPGAGPKPGLLSTAPVRRYKQYTEDSLQAALKEVMEGQSINRSSMKHNIPARTLRDWMKRLNIKSVYTHHNGKDKEGSVGSTSPEPDIAERFRAVAGAMASVNTSTEIEEDDAETLKIDESSQSLSSAVPEMVA